MKKLVCLVMALVLLCGASVALGEAKEIDFETKRNIKINTAGLNATPDEMIQQGISPTTGRNLDEIADEVPNGFSGTVMTGMYQPTMVQISNSNNGFNSAENIAAGRDMNRYAPINGKYADIVYEVCQASSGGATRMTMLFCDTIPDYVGFLRSTRYTHVRLQKEWDCNFVTSGYAGYVNDEWTKYGVPNPMSPNRETDPGPVYVGGVDGGRPWRQYYGDLTKLDGSNTNLFRLADCVNDLVPKDKTYANHTWLFTDELPEGGDDCTTIYVTFGNPSNTDSMLEYNDEDGLYYRIVNVPKKGEQLYMSTKLDVISSKNESGYDKYFHLTATRTLDDPITFSNVIIQGIEMKWQGAEVPDPQLVGTGNADYFMGGKHYAGVWERKDMDSRTVYYDANGNELQLQRGKTLIILMNYNNKGTSVKYE